jgi:hypothetical protein
MKPLPGDYDFTVVSAMGVITDGEEVGVQWTKRWLIRIITT